jgi:GNAT superfamily N-acetyltransferase
METGAETAMVRRRRGTMGFTIREGRSGDRKAVLALMREFEDYLTAIDPVEAAADPFPKRDIEKAAGLAFARDPVCAALIAEAEGRPVGYLAYHFGVWEIYPALFVAGLFVAATARQHGVGRALMAEAQRLAAARGATHMTWMVWRKNAPAIGFYDHLGAESYDGNFQMVWKVAKPPRQRSKKPPSAKRERKP